MLVILNFYPSPVVPLRYNETTEPNRTQKGGS